MKNLLLSLSFFLLFTARALATSGGPDLYGYTWKDSNEPGGPAYHWYDLLAMNGTEVKLLGDDNTRGPFQMNFNFRYYWYDVSQFYVGSNGYLIFGNGQISSPFPGIPSTTLPNNFVAPLMSDLNFSGNGNPAKCYYWISPGHDSLIVSWLNVPFYSITPPYYTGSNSFQVILSKVDTSISFQYQTQSGLSTGTPTQFMSVGIENINGLIGLQNYYDAYPPVNYAIKFYYPQNSSYQAFDATINYDNNETTGGLFLVKGGNAYPMLAQVKNVGNQNLSSFNVNAKVVNNNNVVQVQDNHATNPLAPADTQNISFTNVFNPVSAGRFQFIATTQLNNDVYSGNDSKAQELVVIDTAQPSIRLSFDNGVDAGLGGISWTGGGGGTGMYFIPPFYPCKVTKVHFYIVANPNNAGMNAKLYDDDGIGGLAYTLLDSVYVDSSQIFPASWNDIALDTPYQVITSGGFYVAWEMMGQNISIGQDNVPPFSNRTFEVLGPTWSIYRFRETQDLLMNATIEHATLPNGVTMPEAQSLQISLMPNPAGDAASAYITSPKALPAEFELFNLSGTMLYKKSVDHLNVGVTTFKINTSDLAAGIYLVKIHTDEGERTQKLTVIK